MLLAPHPSNVLRRNPDPLGGGCGPQSRVPDGKDRIELLQRQRACQMHGVGTSKDQVGGQGGSPAGNGRCELDYSYRFP